MKNAVKKREIKFVWHFTRLKNLNSILRHGLISRDKLEQSATPAIFNDEYRYDGQKAAICCSIGHPNYKMFWSLRASDTDEEWIVIGCKSKILWTKDCAFCQENAASGDVTCIPIEDRKGKAAFEKMFEEFDGKPTRKELDLPKHCPTNPQAEILVFDDIETKLLIGAACQTKERKAKLKDKYPEFQFVHAPGLFSARKDFAHWK